MIADIYFSKHEGTLYVAAAEAGGRREPFHKIESVKKAYRYLRNKGITVNQVHIVPYTKY